MKACMLGLLLLLSSAARAADYRSAAEYALSYVCSVTHADCTNLQPPRVRFADLMFLRGWLGYFRPDKPDTVWLDSSFEAGLQRGDWQAMSVLIHETAHYVDVNVMRGPVPGCQAEALAFHVQNLWLLEHGRGKEAHWNWRSWYGC